MNALSVSQLEEASKWAEAPPAKLAVFTADGTQTVTSAIPEGFTALAQYVQCQDIKAEPVLADWLAGIYAVADLAQALGRRGNLPAGAWLVTPQGHLVSAHSVMFHAPDSQVHGILARQREIEQLQKQSQLLSEKLTQDKQVAEQA